MKRVTQMAMLAAAALLAGCDLAPTYHPPEMILPASYTGTGPFVTADPSDQLQRGPWWQMYGDSQLDKLEEQLDAANPDLAAERETWTQAQDVVAQARSGLFPQIGLNAYTSQNGESAHTLFHSSGGTMHESSNFWGGQASWGPDFWDQVRNQTREAQSNAQGVAAAVADARLSLEMQLASDYMAIWGYDKQHEIYKQAIKAYSTAVNITQMRLAGKISSGLDVGRAENQLASAQAADTEVLAQRTLLEHAVAVLVGANPVDFRLTTMPDHDYAIPTVPVNMPSLLLQRRPDVAQAERNMAAANAAIGVSRAAFYPNVRLSATGGFEDSGWGLTTLSNSLWAFGASAVLPLFEGGLRRAELQASWSVFNQASDHYRATVLQAFREVEDDLALTDRLATEAQQQQAAVDAAVRVQNMSLSLYTEGLDNYLNVTVAQIAALDAQIAEAQVQTRRLQTSVSLIGALGGGWSTADLPTPKETIPFGPLAYGSHAASDATAAGR
jgi:outer membrane protein, multidrug efflux system